MKNEYDRVYFNECKRDAFWMITGGVIAIIAAVVLKSHVDALDLTTGPLAYLMCGAGVMGSIFLVMGLALGISLFGRAVAGKLAKIHGLPSKPKRQIYSILCGVNVLALIAATATMSVHFGAVWQTAMTIFIALIGVSFLVGINGKLRDINEDEEEAELGEELD